MMLSRAKCIYFFKHLIRGLTLLTLLTSPKYSLSQDSDKFNLPVVGFEQVQHLLDSRSDTLYVINFWATWCKPCVIELPDFERIQEEYSENPFVKVLLISLDFPEKITSQVIPFIERNKIKSEVWVLVEDDANAWIDLVDPQWSGAIPATIIINSDYRSFQEGTMTYYELKQIIDKHKS